MKRENRFSFPILKIKNKKMGLNIFEFSHFFKEKAFATSLRFPHSLTLEFLLLLRLPLSARIFFLPILLGFFYGELSKPRRAKMSGSETGVIASRGDPFPVGLQKASLPSQPVVQNMRLAFSPDGTAVYKPAAAASAASPSYKAPSAAGNGGPAEAASADGGGPAAALPHGINMNVGAEPTKKKRGRPRKYGPDGTIALGLTPAAPPSTVAPPGGGFSSPHPVSVVAPPASAGGGSGPASPNSFKKRGRPPGSSNKKRQLETLGSLGIGFTPHVITVKAGEDVSSKIMSFSQHGPRAVCILSANGAISNVTLRQPAISGGTVTYEGRFEILSLSGSFLLSESDGHRSRTGGLSVSLSGPDGRVLGGGVAGLLTAASPVQVIVGSFIADGRKESKANHAEPFLGTARIASSGGFTGASSPSHGTLSESSGGPGSPLNQSTGACTNSTPQAMSIVPVPWK